MSESVNLSARTLYIIVGAVIILLIMFFILSGNQPIDIFKALQDFFGLVFIYFLGGLKQILHG